MLRLENLLLHKSHIIWDWNGTLLNDGDLCAQITADIMVAHGLKPLTRDEHRKKFRMPVEAFYKDAGFNFSQVEFKRVAEQFVVEYRARFDHCHLFPGTEALLRKLQSHGKKQAILSASRERELHDLVKKFRIGEYFDHVCGLVDFHAVSKLERGRELMTMWGVAKDSTILVGDMDHDLEVGRALGIEVLLVDNGHQDLRHWLTDPGLAVHRRSE